MTPTVQADTIVGRWVIAVSPPNIIDRLNATPTGRIVLNPGSSSSVLTASGFAAVLSQFATYLTTAKLAAISAAAGRAEMGCAVNSNSAWIDVLAADIGAQVAALKALLATAGYTT